jgi:hypothetical protein
LGGRTINRQKLDRQGLEGELSDPASRRSQVLTRLKALLQARAAQPGFSPYAAQRVLDLHPALFCLLRGETGENQVLCLHNVSGEAVPVSLDMASLGAVQARDLLSGVALAGERLSLSLPPYGMLWLGLDKRRNES